MELVVPVLWEDTSRYPYDPYRDFKRSAKRKLLGYVSMKYKDFIDNRNFILYIRHVHLLFFICLCADTAPVDDTVMPSASSPSSNASLYHPFLLLQRGCLLFDEIDEGVENESGEKRVSDNAFTTIF